MRHNWCTAALRPRPIRLFLFRTTRQCRYSAEEGTWRKRNNMKSHDFTFPGLIIIIIIFRAPWLLQSVLGGRKREKDGWIFWPRVFLLKRASIYKASSYFLATWTSSIWTFQQIGQLGRQLDDTISSSSLYCPMLLPASKWKYTETQRDDDGQDNRLPKSRSWSFSEFIRLFVNKPAG